MELVDIFNETLKVLESYKEQYPDDNIFVSIEAQVRFIQDCHINNLNIKDALGSRDLTYNILASRNLVEPEDTELIKWLSAITNFVIKDTSK